VKLSLYTAVKNGIYYDFHVEAMLRHHLPLADEIIVNEGYSTDDTLVRISRIDPKIKIFQTKWESPKDIRWHIGFKDAARQRCTGDWCIHLDCDEFIPEWEFDDIRRYLESTDDVMIPVRFVNFYGNYKVFHAEPQRIKWPHRKMIIHRNLATVEFWGDGSNVRIEGQQFTWDTSSREFSVHHFGSVRNPARLRQKWSTWGRAVAGKRLFLSPPRVLFDLLPHKWMDTDFAESLEVYEGPYIKAVREDPAEFVRDDFQTYNALVGIK